MAGADPEQPLILGDLREMGRGLLAGGGTV